MFPDSPLFAEIYSGVLMNNSMLQNMFSLVIELNIVYQANNTVGFFQETLSEK